MVEVPVERSRIRDPHRHRDGQRPIIDGRGPHRTEGGRVGMRSENAAEPHALLADPGDIVVADLLPRVLEGSLRIS